MERRYRETDSNWVREEFERYQNNRSCGTCDGFRLRPEALAVKISGIHVGLAVQMSISDALEWISSIPENLSIQKNAIAHAILKEIRERLGFLVNVGLNYLTLTISKANYGILNSPKKRTKFTPYDTEIRSLTRIFFSFYQLIPLNLLNASFG